MNIQERIEALEKEFNEKIEILKSEAQQEQEFFQEIGEYYFHINDTGDIYRTEYAPPYNDNDYEYRKDIGNIFRTRDEAYFVVEKIKVETELRKYSKPYEHGGFNYYLFFDIENDCLDTHFTGYCPQQGAIYFESEEKAQQAIKSVGKERIKKYIFGMEG